MMMAGFSFAPALALLLTVVASSTWHGFVSKEVQSPYLDEVFHVRQAQVYCAEDFATWDPKITTPPGLYLVSYLVFRLTGRCDIDALRTTNVVALCLIVLEAYQLVKLFSRMFDQGPDDRWKFAHTALNIALFPPIFFFSGLYYTDLLSLLTVLLVIHVTLLRTTVGSGWYLAALQLFIGSVSLLFRQTNIFWTAIFPIAVHIIHLQRSSSGYANKLDVNGRVEDYFGVAFDAAWTTIVRANTIILTSLPQIALLAIFVAFVVWNGGVVLGDKSNHVATIHITQMLYLWPFITFFSWPLLAQTLLRGPLSLKSAMTGLSERPRSLVLLLTTCMAAFIVHYNTIIHPFTLADNRHYMFYVFKILRRHWLLRYIVVPIYVIAAWLCLKAAEVVPRRSSATGKNNATAPPLKTTDQRVGLLLIWLATTCLSLVTAPLVEPRYFIVPWTLWRLILCPRTQTKASLSLETMWYLLMNAATGYMFLYQPFAWEQEPGNAQRFMW